ncbi:AraC family transcriptional regulator [Streptomyces sp. H10-C2]|uniref:helix-turn-helix domain-containing protein n=1 Tax=unclassified Streptomyces TaxID=2593676 RepID=UPI0024B9272A|nr:MULTISPECIES: AraC family transcriptional regulator [unclassified Streptomyces]MDJ0341987.1 AraC family transcriptional regulator [Streptomyces sp. PH10-H1]MDJ0369960.1 AraC family transcriptional regulator [Streptomyces sp. H10-C2]MDJ0370039.1 AraC family transcriptional regulator [Streptomyces sp. H10-C2]
MAGDRTNSANSRITAWQPKVPGIAEVFHAHFTDHAYPAHTHDSWTLMIVDDGSVDFGLDRHRHGATGKGIVALLPPGVTHDGRTATPAGFRKRVLYLDTSVLPERLAGTAVDSPILADALLRHRVHQLHDALGHAGDAFEGEARLAFVRERLQFHLAGTRSRQPGREAGRLAVALRELLDARVADGMTLQEAGTVLRAHPTHLIRCFKRTYGLPPHVYLTGLRIDRARRLLLAGGRPADVATEVGFYDQAHLNRHFRRHVGTTPARYATAPRG